MAKGKRNPWHGLLKKIAEEAGCSTTSVSKILNGHEHEVTSNQLLINNVRTIAARLLNIDVQRLKNEAEEKAETAQRLLSAA